MQRELNRPSGGNDLPHFGDMATMSRHDATASGGSVMPGVAHR